MRKRTTMFKLVGPKGTINTAPFDKFDDDPQTGRAMALASITRAKERWGSQQMFEGESLQIIEE